MTNNEKLLSRKELAIELGRSISYINAMIHCGFKMPGNRAKLSAALSFLESHKSVTSIYKGYVTASKSLKKSKNESKNRKRKTR